LVVEAEWEPRDGYSVTKEEGKTRRTFNGNQIWRNPKLRVKDVEPPNISEDEVLIQVKACGICGSDIHFHEKDDEGYILFPGHSKFPLVIGHEFAGVVTEVGSKVSRISIGDKVTAEEMWWCGECKSCRAGLPNHCKNLEELGFSKNGALAEYVKVKERYCWKINNFQRAYESEKDQ